MSDCPKFIAWARPSTAYPARHASRPAESPSGSRSGAPHDAESNLANARSLDGASLTDLASNALSCRRTHGTAMSSPDSTRRGRERTQDAQAGLFKELAV